MKKKISLILFTICFSMSMLVTAFAGSWKRDSLGWWYQEDNGSYPREAWREVNGAWYYFDYDGYMLFDTYTPDGYFLGESGAWDTSIPRRVGLGEIGNSVYGMDDYSLEFGSHSSSAEGEIRSYVNFMGPGMSIVWSGIAVRYETEGTDGLRIYFLGEGELDFLSIVWYSRDLMGSPTVYYDPEPGSLPIEGSYEYLYSLYGN
ncbi:MAG: hypothetical protein Q4A19_09025 [Johnsonella sp.]|nr:hypothetical protein [Johnsonella sp.]